MMFEPCNVHDNDWKRACAAALSSLPGMGPARLRALLLDMPPDTAWAAVATGGTLPPELMRICGARFQELATAWGRSARRTDPIDVLERYERSGVGVWVTDLDYPDALASDRCPPVVLFWQGDCRGFDFPRVAIVGTRHASHDGRAVARQLGSGLAESGVSVVSGLALGIDGAAHAGALQVTTGAPPIAVVGSGLDVVYPKRHAQLWESMREKGLLLSEAPLGAQPEPWRFPARNRIIAALADVVVVVESHERGGSLITVDEADDRGITVMAVPGSVRNPAARGTNTLLAAGFPIACDVDDILRLIPVDSPSVVLTEDVSPPVDPVAAEVLEAIGWQSVSLDQVLSRTGREPSEVTCVLMRLEEEGWVIEKDGWWSRPS